MTSDADIVGLSVSKGFYWVWSGFKAIILTFFIHIILYKGMGYHLVKGRIDPGLIIYKCLGALFDIYIPLSHGGIVYRISKHITDIFNIAFKL